VGWLVLPHGSVIRRCVQSRHDRRVRCTTTTLFSLFNPAAVSWERRELWLLTPREIAADDFLLRFMFARRWTAEIVNRSALSNSLKRRITKSSSNLLRASHCVAVFRGQVCDGGACRPCGASEEGVVRWSEAETALAAISPPEALSGLSVFWRMLISDCTQRRLPRASGCMS